MRIPGWLFIVGLMAIIGLTALLSLFSFAFARDVAVRSGEAGIVPVSIFALQPSPTPPPTLQPAVTSVPQISQNIPTPDTSAQAIIPTADTAPSVADWTDPRRFNLLLLGIDQRSAVDEPGPFRTDTMIVVSVDPARKTAGVLSIPRDLWVSVPGFTHSRINTANYLGDANAYPGGGPALAAETIRKNLGIPVDKYLLVNFDVFTTIVETLAPDGVQVCPTEVIDDPHYPDAGYGTIPVYFDVGCQTLQAERLLQYARTRATEGSDFDRARRQQEVLDAVREKVLSVGGISNFIGQAPALWDELAGSFKTNLTLDEILSMGVLMGQISRDNIRFGVIDNLYVDLAQTTNGDHVLVPRTGAIRVLIQEVFNPAQSLSLSDLKTRSESESASIMVFNNANIPGLAGQTRDWLTGRGVAVTDVGNVPESSDAPTSIYVYTGKIWTARYLAALIGIPDDRIRPGVDDLTDKDIALLIGSDIQPLLSGQ